MGYQITTIAQTLHRINQDLFIPAIQRPYVWQPEQITRLFDSLMRGYTLWPGCGSISSTTNCTTAFGV